MIMSAHTDECARSPNESASGVREDVRILRDEWDKAQASMKKLEDRTIFSVNSQSNTIERLTRELQQMRAAVDAVTEHLAHATRTPVAQSPSKRRRFDDSDSAAAPPQSPPLQPQPQLQAVQPVVVVPPPPPPPAQDSNTNNNNIVDRVDKLERLFTLMSVCPGEQRALATLQQSLAALQQSVDAKLQAVSTFLPAVNKVIDNVKHHAIAIVEMEKDLVAAREEIGNLGRQVDSVQANIAPDFSILMPHTAPHAGSSLLTDEDYESLQALTAAAAFMNQKNDDSAAVASSQELTQTQIASDGSQDSFVDGV